VYTSPKAVVEPRPCPICKSTSTDLLFRPSFQAPETIGLLEGYDLVACQSCGMTFADNIPLQQKFDEYYQHLSKYAYEHRGGRESEDDEWRLKHVAIVLRQFLPDPSTRILEIGCASGRLLGFLKEDGYRHAFGLDPSPACSKAARELYDVTAFTGTIFSSSLPDASYEFAILLGVLEHIRDVDLAVRVLHRFLSGSGRVYIEVPDATNFIAEQDAPFQEFSTEHINFFSPVTLQYLMEAGGFRTIECRSAVRQDRHGKPLSTLYGVFELSRQRRSEFPYTSEAAAGLRRYIEQCRRMDTELRLRIENAIKRSRVIVWGAGTHTQRLLATGALNPIDVSVFVDSNPKYQNHRLAGTPVVRPEAVKDHREPILISSYAFQHEIEDQIRSMELPNEVVLLYGTFAAVPKKVDR
jgi:SAM-dependent methyltransferase